MHSSPSPPAPQRPRPAARAVPLVLVADDDEDILTLVALRFRRSGLEVILARDGEEALELIQTRAPDAAVLDIAMPKLTGLEVVRRLRDSEATKSLPIVLLTARAGGQGRRARPRGGCGRVHHQAVQPSGSLHLRAIRPQHGMSTTSRGSRRTTEVARALADEYGLPFITLVENELDDNAFFSLPERLIRRGTVLPYRIEEGRLQVAVADPSDVLLIDELRLVATMPVDLAVAPAADIARLCADGPRTKRAERPKGDESDTALRSRPRRRHRRRDRETRQRRPPPADAGRPRSPLPRRRNRLQALRPRPRDRNARSSHGSR